LNTKPRFYGKVTVTTLITLVLMSTFSASVFGLNSNLPDPPTRPNTTGPLSGVGGTYGGGVLVLSEPQPNVVADRHKALGKIEQTNEKKTVTIDEKADWGLSMTGPVSNSEMQGILEAIRDLKPPREITLSYDLQGKDDEKRSWTQTGTIYEITQHKIYVVRQAVPAQNELVGIMVVEKPVSLQVKLDSEDCPEPKPVVQVIGVDPLEGFINSITGFFRWLFVDLANDLGLYSFGTVKVYSGDEIAGVMHLRSGESKTIKLPPGSYSVKALVQVFGIPLEMDAGNVAADVPILLTVTLTIVEYVEIILFIIVVFVLFWILRKIFRKYQVMDRVFRRKRSTSLNVSTEGKRPGSYAAKAKQTTQTKQVSQAKQASQTKQATKANQAAKAKQTTQTKGKKVKF